VFLLCGCRRSSLGKVSTPWLCWVRGLFGSIGTGVFYGLAPCVAAALMAAREEAPLWLVAGARGLSLLHAIAAPR
jgi:hypothetical protein